jgi:polysaccharide pyruvyl transferase WcaK-like protein
MSDSIFQNMVRFVLSSDCQTIVVPDEMYQIVSKNKKKIIPYIALTDADLRSCELVVVHKGAMHRLGFGALAAVSFQFRPVYADEVYVCYERKGLIEHDLPRAGDAEEPEFLRHVPPVRDHMRTESFVRKQNRAAQSAVLISAYGVGNIGDDLVSFAAKKMLEDVGIGEVKLAGPSVSYEAICDADLIAVGGGGLFYDSDIVNCANYLYPILEAARQGKPSVVLGVGVQGIKTEIGKRAYSQHLANATFLSVRDPRDKLDLTSFDGTLERTFAGADMAFYMADELRRVGQPFATEKPLALFSVSSVLEARLARQGHELKAVSQQIIATLKGRGYEVLLVLHSEDDRTLFQWLAENENLTLVESASYGLAATARLYASAGTIVTSRFHALILGLIFGKAVVSVFSDTGKTGKLISSYLRSIEAQCQALESFDLNSLTEKLEKATSPDPAEVAHCIAMTQMMRADLARVLTCV